MDEAQVKQAMASALQKGDKALARTIARKWEEQSASQTPPVPQEPQEGDVPWPTAKSTYNEWLQKTKADKDPSFYMDKVKAGAVDFFTNVLPDPVVDKMLGLDPMSYQKEDGTFDVKRYDRDRAVGKENVAQEFLGYQGVKPEGQLQALAGSAVQGTVAEGPMAFLGAKGPIGAGTEVLHSLVANAMGQLGGSAGYQLGDSLDTPEGVKQLMALFGSIIGGTSTAGGRSVIGSGKELVTQAVKEKSRISESADKAAEFTAHSEMKQLMDNALKAQPDMEATLATIKTLQDEIPGLVIPPAAGLAENPVYRKNTEYLLRTNPNAFADLRRSLQEAKGKIDERKEAIFGKTGAEVDAELLKNVPKDYTRDIRNARKRIDALDTQLGKAAETVRSSRDTVAVGESVDGLITAKVKAVKDILSPQYTKLFNNAESAGEMFPASSVQNVHQMYAALREGDVFKSFPGIANRLNTKWKPKESETAGLLGPTGDPLGPKTTIAYEDVPLREMDSLKREINAAIRTTKDPAQRRILNQLKATLKGEIQTLPGTFATAYGDLDKAFWKELGIPFDKEGLSQLDSARFQSQAGAYLGKPEQAADFLSFVGDAGVPVVKDAVLLKMQNSVFNKDGMLDPKNLVKFIKTNGRLIDTVPGLRAELQDARGLVNNLSDTKARLDSEYTLKAKELSEGFFKAFHQKGLEGVSGDILRSPRDSAKYMNDLRNFTPDTSAMVKQSIRASLIEKAMDSPSTMTDFIKKNERVFNQWFGSTYAKDIQSISQAADLINKIDVDKMRFALDYRHDDALSKATGVSFVQAQSVWRDRIANVGTKMAIIGSKMNVASAAAKRDGMLMDLLLHPDSLASIRKQVDGTSFKMTTPEVLSNIASHVNNSVWKGVYFGAAGADEGSEQKF